MTISDAYHDLEDFMLGDEDELPNALTDDITAEKMMRGVAFRRRKFEAAKAVYDAQRAQLDEWLAEQAKRYDDSYLCNCLTSYHQARRAQDPKLNTIHLPSGKLTATGGADVWEFDDEIFVQWAVDGKHEELLRRKEPEPAKSDAKKLLTVVGGKAVTADGETVPGLVIVPGEKSYNVKPGG